VATKKVGQQTFSLPILLLLDPGSGMDKNQVLEINFPYQQHRSKEKEIKLSSSVPDPDPLVRGKDPDPSIILLSSSKNSKQNLASYSSVLLSLKNYINVPSKSNKQKIFFF
jgi:hypothetical protein